MGIPSVTLSEKGFVHLDSYIGIPSVTLSEKGFVHLSILEN